MGKTFLSFILVAALLTLAVKSKTIDAYCEAPNTLGVAAT